MSPRRRLPAEADADYFEVAPRPPRRWGLALVAALAAVLVSAAVVGSALMLVRHEADRRAEITEAAALGYARDFMTMYTSLDPFNANAYADRVLAEGTGEFETNFRQRMNEILIQVAQAEPTTGTVLEAGVQRWNDDGSVDVLVATKVTSTMPDGNTTIESGSRWVATTTKEGEQWKIKNLIQVI